MQAIVQKYRVLSINKLLFLVATIIVGLDNNSLWRSLWGALGRDPQVHFVFIFSFLVLVFTLILLMLSFFGFRNIVKPALALVLILSSVEAYFIDYQHVMFGASVIVDEISTGLQDATGPGGPGVILHVLMTGLLPAGFIWFVIVDGKPVTAELLSRVRMLSVMLLISTLSVFWTFRDYSQVLRQQPSIQNMVNPVYPALSLLKYFKFSVAESVNGTGATTEIVPSASPASEEEVRMGHHGSI